MIFEVIQNASAEQGDYIFQFTMPSNNDDTNPVKGEKLKILVTKVILYKG